MAQPEHRTETPASRRHNFWWDLIAAAGITMEKSLHGTVGLQPMTKDGACKTCKLCINGRVHQQAAFLSKNCFIFGAI